MSNITFLRTRHNYQSYTDFWRLVELSKFPTMYVDEIDLHSGDTYIVTPMTGEFEHMPDWDGGRECTIYHWNLERPCNGTIENYIDANLRLHRNGKVDVTLVSDVELAKRTGFRYIPLGGHPELGSVSADDKVYDFAHLMAYTYRRSHSKLFNHVTPKSEYDGMKIAPVCWGEERDVALKATKFMLSVHQDDHLYLEPLRCTLAACYGLPILSEQVHNSYPYQLAQFNELKGLRREMKRVLAEYSDHWRTIGMEMRDKMTQELTFRKCVERLL